MKKIITSVVALLVMGTAAFAQDTKMDSKKKVSKKTETKMDAAGNKTAKTTTATKETKMEPSGKKVKSKKVSTSTTETKAK